MNEEIERALGIVPGAPIDYRAIYQPTFHPAACIEISGDLLRFARLDGVEQLMQLSDAQRSALASRMQAIGSPEDSFEAARDGIYVVGQIGEREWRGSSPTESEFFVALIELAQEGLHDPLLDHLLRYFQR